MPAWYAMRRQRTDSSGRRSAAFLLALDAMFFTLLRSWPHSRHLLWTLAWLAPAAWAATPFPTTVTAPSPTDPPTSCGTRAPGAKRAQGARTRPPAPTPGPRPRWPIPGAGIDAQHAWAPHDSGRTFISELRNANTPSASCAAAPASPGFGQVGTRLQVDRSGGDEPHRGWHTA